MTKKKLRIFDQAVAIVTGAASGIGEALSEELARRGAEVVLGDFQIELAIEVAARIRTNGGKAKAHFLDVAEYPMVERLFQETTDQLGRLDFVFNNAGIGLGGDLDRHRIDDWQRLIDVNLRGVVNGVQAAYKIMVNQGFGHLVNTASVAGLLPTPGVVSYGMTKHAVVGLSLSLRAEAAEKRVRVSVLCPGVIRTPMLEGEKFRRSLVNMAPEERQRIWNGLRPMPPGKFASKALDAIAKNRAIIVIPSWWRLFWLANRLSPALGSALAKKQYRVMQKR